MSKRSEALEPSGEQHGCTGKLTPGRVQRRRLDGHADQRYFLYVPKHCPEGAPVLVAVHGISRNAREQARAFAPLAERYGVIVVAPLFSASRFPRYQQLGLARDAIYPRPDWALDQILREVGDLTGARSERVHLFGYSGGGQFAHRYAMAYPEKVLTVMLGAPGWYTFPDNGEPYPRGTLRQTTSGLLHFRCARYLEVPMFVLVGERDDVRDAALKRSRKIDEQQGLTRLERGRRWIQAMQEAAAARGLRTSYRLSVLAECGHSFSECITVGQMGPLVFEFMFDLHLHGAHAGSAVRG
jgi:pimeloyl-ACP methyl ester carboxylesterase